MHPLPPPKKMMTLFNTLDTVNHAKLSNLSRTCMLLDSVEIEHFVVRIEQFANALAAIRGVA